MPALPKNEWQKARTCAVSALQTQTSSQCAAFWMSREISWLYTPAGRGDAYRHRCKLLETRIQKSRPDTVGDNSPQPNRKYYMHLKNLSEHYAHQVSREILNFCKENQAGMIVLPDYDQNFTRMAMVKSGNFSPASLKQQDPDQPAVQSLGRRNSGAGKPEQTA